MRRLMMIGALVFSLIVVAPASAQIVVVLETLDGASLLQPGDVLCSLGGKQYQIVRASVEGQVLVSGASGECPHFTSRIVIPDGGGIRLPAGNDVNHVTLAIGRDDTGWNYDPTGHVGVTTTVEAHELIYQEYNHTRFASGNPVSINDNLQIGNELVSGGFSGIVCKGQVRIDTNGVWKLEACLGDLGYWQTKYDYVGSGSPEGVVTAPIGSVYHRTDGGAGTSTYAKESGTGNTGWIAK